MPAQMMTGLYTPALPWVVLRKGITAVDLASGVKMFSTGGGWSQRVTNNAIDLGSLSTIGKNKTPNAFMIAPWMESAYANKGSALVFEVGGYRGINNNYDRIARISAIVGSGRLTMRADGTSVVAAAVSKCYYADTLNVEDFTDGAVDVCDGDGSGVAGKGYVYFDLRGLEYICVNVMKLPTSVNRVGFEISGF